MKGQRFVELLLVSLGPLPFTAAFSLAPILRLAIFHVLEKVYRSDRRQYRLGGLGRHRSDPLCVAALQDTGWVRRCGGNAQERERTLSDSRKMILLTASSSACTFSLSRTKSQLK